jgi:hypothetical protein
LPLLPQLVSRWNKRDPFPVTYKMAAGRMELWKNIQMSISTHLLSNFYFRSKILKMETACFS